MIEDGEPYNMGEDFYLGERYGSEDMLRELGINPTLPWVKWSDDPPVWTVEIGE